MPRTILKIGDLDLDLQGQIVLQTSKQRAFSNFSFQFELFIEHLNVSDCKTGDLDLDLQTLAVY